MKAIKYLVIALLFGGMVSCSGEAGTVGLTTVEFVDTVYETSFGASTFYVPMMITADTEEGLNTTDVKATIAVDAAYVAESADTVVGVADVDGLSGDFRITSLDVNFPDYPGYKEDDDKQNKKKYFDENLNKWVKKVGVEIMLLNTQPEKMEFKLVLQSATTTIGANKECVVRIEKGPQDRLCGAWIMCQEGEPAFGTTISWDVNTKGFIVGTAAQLGFDFPMNFNAETEEVSITNGAYLGMYGGVYHCFLQVTDNTLTPLSDKTFVATYDKTNYSSITFPGIEGYFLCILAYADNGGQPGDLAGYLGYIFQPSFVR